MMHRSTITALASGLLLALSGTVAQAAGFVYEDNSAQTSIPDVATYMTTGAMMDGLKITATFGSFSETLTWAATGADSGGVSGSGWSLNLVGDSFYNAWSFNHDGSHGSLTSLVLDGSTNYTLFDRTFNNLNGTPNSARGHDFEISADSGIYDYLVIYSIAVGVSPNPPVGDLFQKISIDFQPGYAANSFVFMQDTDNDIRATPPVPEPSAIAMMAAGLGLVGYAVSRRRKTA